MRIRVGDRVQWLCNGYHMFDHLPAVTGLSPCGRYCFVEGTGTGIPVGQVVEVRRPGLISWKQFLETRREHQQETG
jgi:hypothetical protein